MTVRPNNVGECDVSNDEWQQTEDQKVAVDLPVPHHLRIAQTWEETPEEKRTECPRQSVHEARPECRLHVSGNWP